MLVTIQGHPVAGKTLSEAAKMIKDIPKVQRRRLTLASPPLTTQATHQLEAQLEAICSMGLGGKLLPGKGISRWTVFMAQSAAARQQQLDLRIITQQVELLEEVVPARTTVPEVEAIMSSVAAHTQARSRLVPGGAARAPLSTPQVQGMALQVAAALRRVMVGLQEVLHRPGGVAHWRAVLQQLKEASGPEQHVATQQAFAQCHQATFRMDTDPHVQKLRHLEQQAHALYPQVTALASQLMANGM
jgi:hypothetical protein